MLCLSPLFRRLSKLFFIVILSTVTHLSFAANTVEQPSMDIDGNGEYDALTDGLVLLRGMFGLDGDTLIAGVIASDATYTSSADIELRIESLGARADIDGDGQIDALTDGLLILRYLFGLRDDALIGGVVASNATRISVNDIEKQLFDTMSDSDNDGILNMNDAFPEDASETVDTDADGVGDNTDAFPEDATETVDTDADGIGNNADTDDDGDGLNDDSDPYPLKSRPIFTSSDTFSVTENQTLVGTVTATDLDSASLGFSVSGSELAITLSGVLSFKTAPDYETKASYTATVTVSDGTNKTLQNITVSVTDLDDTLSGKVIDGYVSGATAFLDLNFNGVVDSNEPSAISGSDGDFVFTLDDSEFACASYVPTVVNVPVGAVDSDSGPVTEAYQMILPPRFISLTVDDVLNISPITSAVWEALESQLKSQVAELSCTTIMASQSTINNLTAQLDAAIEDIVSHYNIAKVQLFADFVADGNTASQETAIKIVKGLKKSFTETASLREQYPDATWAKVNYYFFSSLDGDDLYPNAWYRDLELFNEGTILKEVIKVSDDLASNVRPILYEKTLVSTVGGANLRQEIGYESRQGDASPYSCNFKESLSITSGGAEFEIVNLGSIPNIQSQETCQLPDFRTQSSSRYIFYRSIANGIDTGAQFIFERQDDVFPALNGWFNFVNNMDSLNLSSLVSYIEQLPYGFCAFGAAGATSVTRSSTTIVDGNQITLRRSEDGSYERITIFADGTSLTEQSTIDSAPGWDDCAPYTDTDGDGVVDEADTSPEDASETVDTDSDGIGNNEDVDDDNDGVNDDSDAFPLDASETIDTDSDGIGNNTDVDDDNDGVNDDSDAFPLDASETIDTDSDGIGNNADIDDDNDGVSDESDAFPLDASETTDTDADGVGDNSDILPLDATESLDSDSDGIGDNADTDDDNDGVPDESDALPFDASETVDTDSDGIGNNADTDDDGDGVADTADLFPLDGTETVDTDADGVGDNADAHPNNPDYHLAWGPRNHLAEHITRAQAATLRITSSTAVLISPTYAITVAHSPLDENNEITPDLMVENAWGEKRAIINVIYNVEDDFAVVELESAFDNFGTVPLASETPETGSEVFTVGNPAYVLEPGLTRAVSFGVTYNKFDNDGTTFSEFDIHIAGGYSGGGIFNDKGEILSVNSFGGLCRNTPYYVADAKIHNVVWNLEDQCGGYGLSLTLIKAFLNNYGIEPELITAPPLPENKPDTPKRPLLTDSELQTIEPIIEKSRRATVAIWARDEDPVINQTGSNHPDLRTPNGSGVLISENLVLTAAHVIEGRSNFTVAFTGKETRKARVLDIHPLGDLAILELLEPAPNGYPWLEVSATPMDVDDIGIMVGHPKQLFMSAGGWQISTIKATVTDKGMDTFWGISGAGNSGGPLINVAGEIVGVLLASGRGGGIFTPGRYDNNYTLDIQDPHLLDTAPRPPNPRTPSHVAFTGGSTEAIAPLVFDYIHKDNLERVLGATIDDSNNVWQWKEKHFDNSRTGVIEKLSDQLSLDTSFSEDGSLTLQASNGDHYIPRDINVMPDDRVFILADRVFSSSSSFALFEINHSGLIVQEHIWPSKGAYDKAKSLTIEDHTIYITGDSILDQTRDILTVKCSILAALFDCEDIASTYVFGVDISVGSVIIDDKWVIGGYSDRRDKSDGSTDIFALFLDKNTNQPLLNIGNNGVYAWDGGEGDDTERLLGITKTSDDHVMLLGYQWLWGNTISVVIKLNSDGTPEQSFANNGVFQVSESDAFYKGMSGAKHLVEYNDDYYLLGFQNYAGVNAYSLVTNETDNVSGRNVDVTYMKLSTNGALADTEHYTRYLDGGAQEYLVNVEITDNGIQILYKDELGDTIKKYQTLFDEPYKHNYFNADTTGTPFSFFDQYTGATSPTLACRIDFDTSNPTTKIELNLNFISDLDGFDSIVENYWLVDQQRIGGDYGWAGFELQEADIKKNTDGRYPQTEYQYFLRYLDGRGNEEYVESNIFKYSPENCFVDP